MTKLVVTALHLNLRSEPDPTDPENVIVVLSQGRLVETLDNTGPGDWLEIETEITGEKIRGYVNGKYLGEKDTFFPSYQVADKHLPEADLGPKPYATRAAMDMSAFAIGEFGKPSEPSKNSLGNKDGILQIIDWLDVGNKAHLRYKGNEDSTFCNVYAYDVCNTAGTYLPRVWWTSKAITSLLAGNTLAAKYDDTCREMRANRLFSWLVEYGEDFGWKRVFDVNTLQEEANSGRIALICAQRTNMDKSGHIQIIAPENGTNKAKRSEAGIVIQPLQSNAGAKNFKYGFLGSNWWHGVQFKQFGFWTNAAG